MQSRSLLAVAVASSLVGGCANAKHTMMGVDVGVMAAGAAIRIASDPGNCDGGNFDAEVNCASRGIAGYYAGHTLLAVGALLLLGTAVLWPDSHEPAAAATVGAAQEPTATTTPATATTDIVVLARRASIAARAGHCYEVHELANSIDALDRDYRERELMHDAAIAQCLD